MFRNLFKRGSSTHRVKIPTLDVELDAPKDVPVLEHALAQGVAFPHSCRVGTCGTCKAKLVSGEVYELSDKAYVLSAEELDQGYVLACQSLPRSDLHLELPHVDASADPKSRIPVVEREGTIAGLRKLTHDIVEMTVEFDEAVTFLAGQYCEVYIPGVVPEGESRDSRSYSFASPPGSDPVDVVRFHVRHVPGGTFTTWVHEKAEVGQRLEGHGPYGDFWLRDADAPILAIAGGSGMAPLKALLEQAAMDGVERDVHYFFGARRQEDIYCAEAMAELAARWKGSFEFTPVLSGEPEGSDWTGPRGFVSEHVREALGDRIAQHHVYMCGPPPMLDSAEKIVLAAGVAPSAVHADKFYDRSHTQPRG